MIHVRGRVLFRADIAQLVEQRIRNAKVVGSTPIIGTIFFRKIIKLLLQCFALFNTNVHFARCGCEKFEATDDQYICFNELNNAK